MGSLSDADLKDFEGALAEFAKSVRLGKVSVSPFAVMVAKSLEGSRFPAELFVAWILSRDRSVDHREAGRPASDQSVAKHAVVPRENKKPEPAKAEEKIPSRSGVIVRTAIPSIPTLEILEYVGSGMFKARKPGTSSESIVSKSHVVEEDRDLLSKIVEGAGESRLEWDGFLAPPVQKQKSPFHLS